MALPDSVFDDSDLQKPQAQSALPDSVFDDSDLQAKAPSMSPNLSPNSLAMPDVDYINQLRGIGAYGAGALNQAAHYAQNLLPLTGLPQAYQNLSGQQLPNMDTTATQLGQSLQQSNPNLYAAGKMTTNVAPYLLGGGAGGITDLSQSIIPYLAKNVGLSAGLDLANNPEHPIESIVGGGLSGLAGALVPKAIQGGANATLSALKTPLNRAATSLGITLPIGTAAQNVYLGRVLEQNVLPTIPFSGMGSVWKGIGDQLNSAANEAIESIRPSGSVSQIPNEIQGALQKAYSDAQTMKRTLYNNVSDRANAIGTGVLPNNYLNGFNDLATGLHTPGVNDLLAQSKDVLSRSPELSLSPETEKFLQKISSASGEPKSFGESSLVMGKLNNFADQLDSSGNYYESSLVRNLRPLMQKDMEQAAYNSGDPSLISEWQNAQQHYANEIAPFEDRDLQKYLQHGVNADNPDLLINSFLKTGPNNQPTLLNKLLSKLPQEKQNDIGYYYLTKSLPRDEVGAPIINTNTVSNLNEKLQNYDPHIRNALIPDEVQKKLGAINYLRKNLPNPLINPPTGIRGGDIASSIGLGSAALGALGTAHPALSLAGLAAGLAGANAATKASVSPAIRNLLTSGLGNRSTLGPVLTNFINATMGSNNQ